MNKLKYLLFTALLVLLSASTPVLAKNGKEKDNQAKSSAQAMEEDDDYEDEMENEQEDDMSPKEIAQEKNTIKKLNKITEEIDDPEVVDEVEQIAEDQEEVEDDADDALEEIDKRSSFIKFLIGPDYKNLGQLRRSIVQIQNNIRQLEQVKERAGETEQENIEEALQALQQEQTTLRLEVNERSSGFSLFGWLFNWLSGTPEPEPTSTPTPSPTASPTASPEL